MSEQNSSTAPKRLRILEDEEIAALYNRPAFTHDERAQYCTFTHVELERLQLFSQLHTQLVFLLQLAYFKAKQLFFTFTLDEVEDDVQYLRTQFFPHAPSAPLKAVSKPTRLKQHDIILRLSTYRLCTTVEREHLMLRALSAAKISSKPIYIFRELLHYLTEQRLVAPGYTILQDIVSQALTTEEQRLTTILQAQLTVADRRALDRLFDDTQGLYTLTRLKHTPKDFSLKETRHEILRGEELLPLYQLATHILPQLAISNEGIKYYASLVSYYSVFRLKQLDGWIINVYLLCFVLHRYQQLHDNLLTCFLHVVKDYIHQAKAAAKEQVYEHRLTSNQDLPKAGSVLKLFISNHDPDTPLATVQAKAFAMLERQRLERLADYMVTNASFDETAFQWSHIDTLDRRFKQHLRPILRAVPFAATRVNAPILEAVEFLTTAFEKGRPLSQLDPATFPTHFIPVRHTRYVYGQGTDGSKQIIPDRYEFLVYRMVRNGLEAGDLFCPDSVRFRSFEDDLVDDQQWQDKATLLACTGRPILLQPIAEHLAKLEQALEERIVAVNQRIDAGENTHFHIKRRGGRTRWTLQYPKGTEPINHSVFDTIHQVNIGSLLAFVNHHCQFMACFDHVLGRYIKQTPDERIISACLIAWGTNKGLGRMGELSDISCDTLARTSENFIRPETLKAANDCVSNAIAALPIFRHYDLGDLIHSSSDGQKFETDLPTFNARHSPKYFGLKKGVVAYTLLANHVPVNARIIGAHEHESHYVFDLLFNNTTVIQPHILSTDTHGTNQVNFALLHIFGYQFAPRYQGIHERIRTSLYGFKHPSQYGNSMLKPIRKINTELIIAEWENTQRIFVSLAIKTTTQSIIVSKLNAYTRKNKTRQALWEYDHILQSLYLLDFVDSPPLRQNVQRALNRGENYHQLRRAVSYANFGKLRFKSEEDQMLWSECSRLITNSIIFYNALILSRLLAHKEARGDGAGATLIPHVSPIAWQHLNFYGRYEFTKGPESINLDMIVEALAKQPITPVDNEA